MRLALLNRSFLGAPRVKKQIIIHVHMSKTPTKKPLWPRSPALLNRILLGAPRVAGPDNHSCLYEQNTFQICTLAGAYRSLKLQVFGASWGKARKPPIFLHGHMIIA